MAVWVCACYWEVAGWQLTS